MANGQSNTPSQESIGDAANADKEQSQPQSQSMPQLQTMAPQPAQTNSEEDQDNQDLTKVGMQMLLGLSAQVQELRENIEASIVNSVKKLVGIDKDPAMDNASEQSDAQQTQATQDNSNNQSGPGQQSQIQGLQAQDQSQDESASLDTEMDGMEAMSEDSIIGTQSSANDSTYQSASNSHNQAQSASQQSKMIEIAETVGPAL